MSSTVCVSASWRSVSRSRRSSILINLILAQVPDPAMQKAPTFRPGLLFNLGNVLLSHTLARAVPSGLKGLTSVFGMGTGGSPSLQSPKTEKEFRSQETEFRIERSATFILTPDS